MTAILTALYLTVLFLCIFHIRDAVGTIRTFRYAMDGLWRVRAQRYRIMFLVTFLVFSTYLMYTLL